MLKEMREIANSFVEGSDSTMSEDGLQDLLDTAHAHFLEIREAILRQVANAQQQLIDASGGFQACTTKELAGLRQSVGQHAAAVESCQSTSAQLQAAERQQCATTEDCLCDEARVRTTDQEALCTAVTETYEAVFCEQHTMCASSQQCHSSQAEVYQRLTTDVQGEIGLIREEYTTTEQGICINRLTRQYQTGRRPTVIPRALLDACDDVDLSALDINHPAVPAPPMCPPSTQGGPQCSSVQFFRNLIGHANMIGTFREDDHVSGAGGNFLTRVNCASRMIRAHVQGGSCGDATVQFRIDDAAADYFRSGSYPSHTWQGITDVTVVSGEVADPPEGFYLSNSGWFLATERDWRANSGRGFASSFKNRQWDTCNSNFT